MTKHQSAVPSGGSASAGDVSSPQQPAGASFHADDHVRLLSNSLEYFHGKVLERKTINGRVECRVLWDDGVTTWLPAYRLEPHGVETELGWDVP